MKRLCEFAFSELGMNRIQIKCAVGNEGSKRIPLRLGFTLEGVERDGELLSGGVYTDLEVYSLLKRDFSGDWGIVIGNAYFILFKGLLRIA